MKKLCIAFLMLTAVVSNAQISPRIYGEKGDFENLKARPLLIEILEEDPKTLKKLSGPKKADELKDYVGFIKEFNENFKIYVQKYWKLNSKFEFKTVTEVNALNKAKNSTYAVIRFVSLNDIESFGLKSGLSVPAIVYTRIESDRKKPDAKNYLPFRYFGNDGKSLNEGDYKYVLETLQANVNWIVKNDKSLNFNEFSEKMAKENCSKLKGKTLLIEDNMMMKGRSTDEAKTNYGGDLKFVSEKEINDAFVNKTKNTAVLYAAPYGIMKGSALVVQVSRLVYFKIIVDCETGEILYLYMPGGLSYGANITNQMTETEFKTLRDCKIL